jgi:hypothetical protein
LKFEAAFKAKISKNQFRRDCLDNVLGMDHDFSADPAAQFISLFFKEKEVQSGLNFEEEVAQRLGRAGVRFEMEPTVNGLQPGLFAPIGEESFLVIEAKIKSNLLRDSKLLELWKTTNGAEQALMLSRSKC